MKARPVFREKRLLIHSKTGEIGVAEIKIWGIRESKDYPEGRKFSLFLVVKGRTLIGIDNHRPKGPHLHLGEREVLYAYQGESKLLEDFWDFVRKAGFES